MNSAKEKTRNCARGIGIPSTPSGIAQSKTQQFIDQEEAPAGHFTSWKIEKESTQLREGNRGDQIDPGLLFINQIGPEGPPSRERKQMRSHVMQRYVHQRNEIEVERDSKRRHIEMHSLPDADRQLGAGDLDPFYTLPVPMSSSNSRLLHYFAKHIAPLHYPHGRVGGRDPMTTRWIASAATDAALLHSTLGSSSGHMLYYANLPTLSPGFLSSFLYHKTETMRLINERMTDTSKVLTDETMGAIALLITGQTCQGDYDEMKIHMRGLVQLVGIRGGLETLGMGGLLAGEILWCDNVTAFLSSSETLLSMPRGNSNTFEAFEDPKLNLFLAALTTDKCDETSPLYDPAIEQILPNDLITALHRLQKITALLNTSPTLSEHDMLVYDRRRASIQHQLANVSIPSLIGDSHQIANSFRLATIIYSVLALWGFKPPMNLYGDLAKPLQTALQAIGHIDHQGVSRDIMLWTLFIGGHATSGRQEHIWFSTMMREALEERDLKQWHSVRGILETMPVYHTLWDPFEILCGEALDPHLEQKPLELLEQSLEDDS